MLELFLKIQENVRISILKRRLQNLYKKQQQNFKSEIKLMIENLQDELYKTNQQKVLNLVLTLDETRGRKMPQNFLQST